MKVHVNNIKVYAYHGCLDEEGIIGSEYRVDAVVDVKNKLSHQNDDLDQTVDYSLVTQIVVEEMAIRSKLIETVAAKIIKRILNECTHSKHVSITVTKINPPIEGDVETVSVTLSSTDI
nr:dihydroneopterin aldolase [uncultured bacterium]